MSTLQQIEANRLNAAKSTGPRTEAGKSAVRLNALKHGLFAADPVIPGEDPAHLEALHTGHYDRFQPATTEEHVLVAALVRDAWRLERCSNSETAVWARGFDHYKNDEHCLARSESNNAKELMHIQRRIDSAERNYRRNLELLIKLQASRKKADPALERIPQPQPAEPLKPENGFVPANPQEPARHRVTVPILGYKSRPETPPEAA